MSYLYQGRNLSFNLLIRGFTRDYSNISIEKTLERIKYETSAGAGYTSTLLGSLSLGFSAVKKYSGTDTKILSASYSRKITDRSNIIATFKRDMESNVSEFMIGLNYYFKHGITASASHQRADGTSSERIQVLKNLPLGEGFGGRASFERNHEEQETYNNYNLQLQYNAKYGQVAGEFISTNHVEAYSFSAAGGVSFVKDTFNFSRPIQDSFALVKVGDLKGVRVYLNNQEIGRTGASGKVLIPNLGSYYDNQISISDKDIPIEYTLTDVLKYVSPPLRSGSYIEFGATKIQAFTGTLKVKVHGEVKPVEYIEFKLLVDGKELDSSTGKGGELYLENIKPGKYKGEFKYLDKMFTFDIIIPKSEEVLVDLGEINCE
jgi:outer membrane usher protein